jgi:hypothetical protein
MARTKCPQLQGSPGAPKVRPEAVGKGVTDRSPSAADRPRLGAYRLDAHPRGAPRHCGGLELADDAATKLVDPLGVNERQEGQLRSLRQVSGPMPGDRGHCRVMRLLPFAAAAYEACLTLNRQVAFRGVVSRSGLSTRAAFSPEDDAWYSMEKSPAARITSLPVISLV